MFQAYCSRMHIRAARLTLKERMRLGSDRIARRFGHSIAVDATRSIYAVVAVSTSTHRQYQYH